MFFCANKAKKIRKDKRNVRSLCYFITHRMCRMEVCLCVIGVLFVILYCIARIDESIIDRGSCLAKDILSFLRQNKEDIDALTYSIIPAFFVYFVTVVIPESKRSQAMLPSICERLRYIKDAFYELSYFLTNSDWVNDSNYLDKALENVARYGTTQYSNRYSLKLCDFFLQLFVEELDKQTDFILQFHNELTPKELKSLLEIKFSSLIGKIREGHFKEALYEKEAFNEVITEFRELNIKAISIYNKLCNRVYVN